MITRSKTRPNNVLNYSELSEFPDQPLSYRKKQSKSKSRSQFPDQETSRKQSKQRSSKRPAKSVESKQKQSRSPAPRKSFSQNLLPKKCPIQNKNSNLEKDWQLHYNWVGRATTDQIYTIDVIRAFKTLVIGLIGFFYEKDKTIFVYLQMPKKCRASHLTSILNLNYEKPSTSASQMIKQINSIDPDDRGLYYFSHGQIKQNIVKQNSTHLLADFLVRKQEEHLNRHSETHKPQIIEIDDDSNYYEQRRERIDQFFYKKESDILNYNDGPKVEECLETNSEFLLQFFEMRNKWRLLKSFSAETAIEMCLTNGVITYYKNFVKE